QGAAARILAAFDRVHPRRIRHVLVDDLADTARGELDRQPQRIGHALMYRRLGGGAVERHAPAGKTVRIDAPKQQIGIRYGRVHTAAAVAGRSWVRAGAVRSDGDPLQPVDARDRAAPGADLDHLDDRDAQRQPAAFFEAVDARDLEG